MLKWEKIGDLYVAHVSDECAYTVEHDMDTTHGGWRSTFTTAPEWLLHDTLKEAKTACESDYARRVAEIAATNGYQRVGADQIVVRRTSLCAVVKPNYQSRECSCEECTAYRELLAALDETGKVTE